MRFILPQSVKTTLAERSFRLHHLLWHTIRNNWHKFTRAEQETFRNQHPHWIPLRPRFVQYPSGLVMVNNDAGESFLYMHSQMIASVNKQLISISEPEIVPWPNIPAPGNAEYPVPGRTPTVKDKSDDFYNELRVMEENLRDLGTLRRNSLAQIGAYLESSIHDPLHRRWATVSPGQMENFPVLDPKNPNPVIDTSFDTPDADWLAHPYSSHVNSIFWELHGWCDQVIDQWRIANNLSDITWTDTWVGGAHHHEWLDSSPMIEAEKDPFRKHAHLEPDPHSDHELLKVFKTINSFEDCQIGFDYLEKNNISLPELK